MRKYRPPLTKNELEELKRLTILSFYGWTEADIREEFVVPLLKLLGYRKELDYSVSREESFRLNPLFLQIGRDRIKLDYICSVRKQRFWIIESKPGKLLKDDTYPKLLLEDIAQAHFYSMHPDIDAKYFVVTNGWLLDLYDRDKFNERMEPILSIKHTELEREFLKLDSYIGASQIIFTLKSKILKDIENTLRSEVYIDRLDEFVDAVKLKVSKVRPIVLDNFRRNAKIQKDIIEKEFNDFLLKEDLDFIVSSLFMSNPPAINLYKTSRIAAERFINEPSAKQYLFLHRLLLKEPRAVLYPYYYYVLVFLIELKKLGMKVLPYNNIDINKQIADWIELSLFHFWNLPAQRYLWAFEGLIGRVIIRMIYTSQDTRESIYNITKLGKYFMKEEVAAWQGPVEANYVIHIIEHKTITILSKLVDEFMTNGKLKVKMINQEFERFSNIVNQIELATNDEYQSIRRELGDSWGELRFYDSMNLTWDALSSGICNIIYREEEIINSLPEYLKSRILLQKHLKVANYADKCAEYIDREIDIDGNINELIKEYFDINTNPYTII